MLYQSKPITTLFFWHTKEVYVPSLLTVLPKCWQSDLYYFVSRYGSVLLIVQIKVRNAVCHPRLNLLHMRVKITLFKNNTVCYSSKLLSTFVQRQMICISDTAVFRRGISKIKKTWHTFLKLDVYRGRDVNLPK